MDYIEKRFCYTVPTDLNLYYCGKRIRTKNHSYGPQIRDHFLLVYIKEGNAILTVRSKHYTLSKGQLLCMFPGEKIYYTATEESVMSSLWVGVYGSHVDFYLKNLGIKREYPIYNCPKPEETENAIEKIIELADLNNIYGKMSIIARLYDFFASLYNTTAEQFSNIVPAWDIQNTDNHEIEYRSENLYIREAENYIRFHYDSNISIQFIAKTLNLSCEYFSRLFKAETGMTPQDMIMSYRIKKACVLLKSTSLPIAEIASCVGIHDQRYFSKLFKSKKNCTPSQYRNKQNC